MFRPKGLPKTGGRKKGTPNKVNALLKDAIIMAANQAHPEGMVGYLTKQANENPGPFLTLLGKVLPMTIAAPSEGKGGFTLVIHERPKE